MSDFGLRIGPVCEDHDGGPLLSDVTITGQIEPSVTGPDGRATIDAVYVTAEKPGYVPYLHQRYQRPSLDPAAAFPIALIKRDGLPRVSVDGIDFRSDGQRWLWKGATDFAAFWKHLDGRLDDAVLEQRRSAGANLLRVFLNWGDKGFNPSSYGQRFFDELRPFAKRLEAFELYAELVLFAPKPLSPEFDQHVGAQIAFASRVYEACTGVTNVMFELGNEAALDGHLAIDEIPSPPPPFIWASGVYDVYDRPYRKGMYLTFHPRRDYPKLILEMAPIEARREDRWPAVPDEPARCPDHYSDPQVAYEMGRLASAGNGGTLHTNRGRDSELWDATELACAKAFYGAF